VLDRKRGSSSRSNVQCREDFATGSCEKGAEKVGFVERWNLDSVIRIASFEDDGPE
jgi:hypothetical protein